MPLRLHIRWVYILSGIYVLFTAAAILREHFLFLLAPATLVVLFMALFALDKLIYVVIFLTPLSIPLRELTKGMDFDVYLPTEPILVGITLLFFLKLLIGKRLDRKVLYHPVSLAIYFYLFWTVVTSVTSTMPVVSFKDLLSRVWFIVVFYFLMTQLFRSTRRMQYFFWFYIAGLVFVIAYTLYNQYTYGLFDHKVANWAPDPLYNDHTAYGAALAFYLPFQVGMMFNRR